MKVFKRKNNYIVELETENECRIFDEIIRHSSTSLDFEAIVSCIDYKNINTDTIEAFIEELYQKFCLNSTKL